MTARALTLLFLSLSALACRAEPEPEPPVAADLGIHRAQFRVPPGWLHVNHGREQRFERELAQISLSDLGPATPEGFAESIREARELFRVGQWEDARTLLVSVDPRRFFASRERWEGVRKGWKSVTHIRRWDDSDPPGEIRADVALEVEAAFHLLLVEVAATPQPDFETLAMSALAELGHDSMRDIASKSAMAVSGRPAIRIDSWDRLSHLHRLAHLFVLSEGRLLCLRMETGRNEMLDPAFEFLLSSLAIGRPQDSGGAL